MGPQPYESRVSLWDLDNCTSDDSWRVPKIDWHLLGAERYARYDAEMGRDRPANLAEWKIITSLSRPVFITGRRECWRKLTRSWISRELFVQRHGKPVWLDDPLILMRPDDNDDRPAELKRKLLAQLRDVHGISFDRIIAAFDDVQSIVDMYLHHGLPAAVLRVHPPELMYSKADLS